MTEDEIDMLPVPQRTGGQRTRVELDIMNMNMPGGDDGMRWASRPDLRPACDGVVMADSRLDAAFFPDTAEDARRSPGVITRYCVVCPVMAECLECAITNDYVGVWGGQLITRRDVALRRERLTTERRRRRLQSDHDIGHRPRAIAG